MQMGTSENEPPTLWLEGNRSDVTLFFFFIVSFNLIFFFSPTNWKNNKATESVACRKALSAPSFLCFLTLGLIPS